jgi:hypothetical protein
VSLLNRAFNKDWWLSRADVTITYHAFVKLCNRLPNVKKLSLRMTARSGYTKFSPAEVEQAKSTSWPLLSTLSIARCAVMSLPAITPICVAIIKTNASHLVRLTLPVEMASELPGLPQLQSLRLLGMEDKTMSLDFVYDSPKLRIITADYCVRADLDPSRLTDLEVVDMRLLTSQYHQNCLASIDKLAELLPNLNRVFMTPLDGTANLHPPTWPLHTLDKLLSCSSSRVRSILLNSFMVVRYNWTVSTTAAIIAAFKEDCVNTEKLLALPELDIERHLNISDIGEGSAIEVAYQNQRYKALDLILAKCKQANTLGPFRKLGYRAVHCPVLGEHINTEYLDFALNELKLHIDARSPSGDTAYMRLLWLKAPSNDATSSWRCLNTFRNVHRTHGRY